MQMDASARILHVALDPFGGVARVVVYGQVQLSVAAVDPAQPVEQLDEQLVVLTISSYPVQAPRGEVERPADPHLAVGARRSKGPLFTFAHPAESDLGVRLQAGLVLKERSRLLDHRKDVQEPPALVLLVIFGVLLGRDRARPPPAKAQTMEHATEGLRANQDDSPLEQLHGQKLAAPARAQPAVFGGRALFDQTLDVLARCLCDGRFGTSPLAITKGHSSRQGEASGDRINGGPGAEEDPGDLGGRKTLGAEQHYVHPQPPARSPFA